MTVLDGVRLCVGTLTALPIRPPASLRPPVPGIAMALAPAAGAIPGVAAWIVAAGAGFAGLSPFVAAALAVGTLALTTRGLHLDGLADTADGLAASYQRERALEVMRRGDTGPAGMATVAIMLLMQVAALTQAFTQHGWDTRDDVFGDQSPLWTTSAVLLVAIAARVAVPLVCSGGVPAARPEGLGATVAGCVPIPAVLLSAGAAALACGVLADLSGRSWLTGPVAVLVVVLAAGLLLRRAVRRFGGMTGDVIGACIETGTAAALLVLAAS